MMYGLTGPRTNTHKKAQGNKIPVSKEQLGLNHLHADIDKECPYQSLKVKENKPLSSSS